MRVKAVAFRIFTELKHDKRTLALVLFAPILMLTLIFFVLNSSLSNSNVGVLNAPSDYFDRLYDNNVTTTRFLDEKLAFESLDKGEITAIINIVYVLGIMMIGSIWLVLLITLLTAISALTLGMLLSTAASSQFQMLQFIPIIIVPQIFFCGLFQLSPGWDVVGRVMPLYYSADALNEIMVRGNGFNAVLIDILVLLVFSTTFVFGNIKLLKKYRNI